MKLFLLPGCPFAHRATLALREKTLEFTPVFFRVDQRPAELDAVGPHAKSPTLFDGDERVWDSQIVVEYLDDRYPTPALLPRDPAGRAAARMLAARVDRELGSKQGVLVMELVIKPKDQRDDAKVEATKRELLGMLSAWDDRLGDAPFLGGDTLGLADLTLFTLLAGGQRVAGLTIPPELARLAGWYERIAARPSSPLVMPS